MQRPSRKSALSDQAERALDALRRLGRPASGRRIAAVMEVAPATAIRGLRELEEANLVSSEQSGRARLWIEATETSSRTIAPAGGEEAPASREAPRASQRRTALVLTALELEYREMRALLTETSRTRLSDGTRLEHGEVEGVDITWDLVIGQLGMGNVNAAVAASSAINELHPDLVLFVGIAGGLKASDQKRGDVVIADRVYSLHSGKYAGGDFLSRPESVAIPHRLRQLAMTTARDLNRVTDFQSFVKPVAAGEVVLADANSPSVALLFQRINDAAAVDMESYGVYEAAGIHDVPALAIRGLSDLVGDKEPNADARWQPIAARNAALVAHAILRSAAPGDLGAQNGGRLRPPPVPSVAELDARSVADLLSQLPPGATLWASRAGFSSHEALVELAQHAAAPATWLSRVRHRPPAWLRSDSSGDLWALVASVASAHDHPVAEYAWRQASTRADAVGDQQAAAWHRILAHIEAVNSSEGNRSARAEAARRALQDEARGNIDAVIDFFSTAVAAETDSSLLGQIIEQGETALDYLGLERVGGLAPSELRHASLQASALEPALVRSIGYSTYLAMSQAFVALRDLDRALAATRLAEALIPGTSTPRRLAAVARLAAMDWEVGSSASAITRTLRLAEQEALIARARSRGWHGPAGADLAIAGRARTRSGDPRGALQMMLPPPRGRADDNEARHPDVRAAASQAALLSGQSRLAIELASGIEDPIERDLAIATAYLLENATKDVAEQTFRKVLSAASSIRPDQLVRALLGLVRVGVSFDPASEGNVAAELEILANDDPEAADLIRAHGELEGGRPQAALRLARQYPDSPSAVDLAAQAAAESGQPEEGIRLLDRAGQKRGEEFMRARAMDMAVRSGREGDALSIASSLAGSSHHSIRRQALEVRLEIALRRSEWLEAIAICSQLIETSEDDEGEDTQPRLDSYRWTAAGALYHLRRPEEAIGHIDSPTPLSPRTRDEALLTLALLHALRVDSSAPSTGETDHLAGLSSAIEIGKSWADDEAVLASALSYIMLASASLSSMTPVEMLDIRTLQEKFFNDFPQSKLLTRIDVGDNLENLVEYLRASFEPSAKVRTELARGVWQGQYPLGLLAEVTPRSYAEIMITGGVGCILAVDPDEAAREEGRHAARQAFASGAAVADVSALVVVADCGIPTARILAPLRGLVVAECARDDILESRARLSMMSSGSIGWDAATGKPTMSEYSEDDSRRWHELAKAAADTLAFADAVPSGILWPEDAQGPREGNWSAGVSAAQQLRVPLWADDVALRKVARSLDLLAFGTKELLEVLREDGVLGDNDLADALAALQRRRVVDLGPEAASLLEIARREGFDPRGYAPLALSRPAAWTPVDRGFRAYTSVMRELPESSDEHQIAVWANAGFLGAANACAPLARPRVVAYLVVWTLMSCGGPPLFPALLDVAEATLNETAPGADAVSAVVNAFSEFLGSSLSPAEVVQAISQYSSALEDERRLRVLGLLVARS